MFEISGAWKFMILVCVAWLKRHLARSTRAILNNRSMPLIFSNCRIISWFPFSHQKNFLRLLFAWLKATRIAYWELDMTPGCAGVCGRPLLSKAQECALFADLPTNYMHMEFLYILFQIILLLDLIITLWVYMYI